MLTGNHRYNDDTKLPWMLLLNMLIGTEGNCWPKRKSELGIQDTLATMSHVIYSYPHNPHVAIAKITGKFGGVTNIEERDLQFGFTNRTQEFLSLNPFGWVPTLKTVDGNGVFESLAISRYIARIGSDTEGLLGATPIEQARVDQWTDVVFTELFPHVSALYEFKLGYGTYDETKFNNSSDAISKVFFILEKFISNDYLLGDRVTLADIVLGVAVLYPLKLGLDAEWRKPFPKTVSYLTRLYSNPNVQEIVGVTQFC